MEVFYEYEWFEKRKRINIPPCSNNPVIPNTLNPYHTCMPYLNNNYYYFYNGNQGSYENNKRNYPNLQYQLNGRIASGCPVNNNIGNNGANQGLYNFNIQNQGVTSNQTRGNISDQNQEVISNQTKETKKVNSEPRPKKGNRDNSKSRGPNVKIRIIPILSDSSDSIEVVDLGKIPYDENREKDENLQGKIIAEIDYEIILKVLSEVKFVKVQQEDKKTKCEEEEKKYELDPRAREKKVQVILRTNYRNKDYKTKFIFIDEQGKEKLRLSMEFVTMKTYRRHSKGKDYKEDVKAELINDIDNDDSFIVLLYEITDSIFKRKLKNRISNEIIKERSKNIENIENFKGIFRIIKEKEKEKGLYLSCFKDIYDYIISIVNNTNNQDEREKIIEFSSCHPGFLNFMIEFNYGLCKNNDIIIFPENIMKQYHENKRSIIDNDDEEELNFKSSKKRRIEKSENQGSGAKKPIEVSDYENSIS